MDQAKTLHPVDYLRISVTDRCLFRCVYCMPAEGVPALHHEDILRYEEILRLVRVAVRLGVSKVRVTGGEPLVRKGVVPFIGRLAAVEGIRDVGLTTNGALLEPFAAPLREAGLRRVNVSLDTLRPDRFRDITRGGDLRQTLAGIGAALREGFSPVKINVVVMRDRNLDEIGDFVDFAATRGLHVRFIECMRIGGAAEESGKNFASNTEVMRLVSARARLVPWTESLPGMTARMYRIDGTPGHVGFISPLSEHFCGECNRLRLTPDGQLRHCLLDDSAEDLRALLRSGADDDAILAAVRTAAARKRDVAAAREPGNWLRECRSNMSGIGG